MSEARKVVGRTEQLITDVVIAAVSRGRVEGLATGIDEGRFQERERAVRLYDHHVAGRVVDDDTARILDAFSRDLRSGAEPWK